MQHSSGRLELNGKTFSYYFAKDNHGTGCYSYWLDNALVTQQEYREAFKTALQEAGEYFLSTARALMYS